MILVTRFNANFRSCCALGSIALFVLFLLASAPHRVHHLLENLSLRADLAEPEKIEDKKIYALPTNNDNSPYHQDGRVHDHYFQLHHAPTAQNDVARHDHSQENLTPLHANTTKPGTHHKATDLIDGVQVGKPDHSREL